MPPQRTATKRRTPARKSTRRRKPVVRSDTFPCPDLAHGERAWFIEVPYGARNIATYNGARWYTGPRAFCYVGKHLPPPLQRWRPKPYSWAAWRETDMVAGDTGVPINRSPDRSTGTFTLRKDQEASVLDLLAAHRAGAPELLDGSGVGTGKTPTAIALAKRVPGAGHVLVVCPKSVIPAWRKTIRAMGDGGKRWCIINYESLKQLLSVPESAKTAAKQSTRNRRIAKDGQPLVAWDVVISDESHLLANAESQRSICLDRVIAGPSGAKPALPIRLSATAGANPAKLIYLHRGLFWRTGRTPLPTINNKAYVQWCDDRGIEIKAGQFGTGLAWASKNPTDLKKMHYLLFKGTPPWGVKRVVDWPEQQRIEQPIELTPQDMDAYEAEWDAFKSEMARLEKLRKAGPASPTATGQGQGGVARAKGLAAQTRYRQKVGQIKASYVADFVTDMLTNGLQVAVSCEFLGTAQKIREELEARHAQVAMFTGANTDTREDERLAYQRGERNVMIFTVAEGIDLHQGDANAGGNDVPRVTVIAEPRWSPVKGLQIEGRGTRNGTMAPAYYLYAEDTVEQQVLAAQIEGMVNVNTIMGTNNGPLAKIAAALGVPFLVGETS